MTNGDARRLAFGGLLAMAAAMGIGRFVLTPILPSMLAGLGWSKLDGGLLASANFAGYLAGALGAGLARFASRPRPTLLAALLVATVGTALMGVASSFAVLAGLRFVAGAASAFVLVCASALVLARLQSGNRAGWAPVHFAGVGAGMAASAVVVAGLGAHGADWRLMWLVSGGLGCLAALAVPLLIPPRGPETAPVASAARDARGAGARLVIAYGLFGFGYIITATFLVTLVRETPQIRPLEPWIWLVVGLAAMPSVMVWQWLGGRIGLLPAFAVAALAEAAGVAASVEWVSPAGAVLAAFLLGATFMGLTALGLMAGRQLAPEAAQRTLAMLSASFAFGQMVGPTLAGLLAEATGSLRAPSLVAAAGLVVAAVLVLVEAAARRRR